MIDMLNEFLSGIDGKPTMFLGNSKIIAKLKSVAQRAGYLTQSEDAFGKAVRGYDDILFMIWATTSTAVPLFLACLSMKQAHHQRR